MIDNLVELNIPRIKEELFRQELKKWWVAESIGIHTTTLRKWLSGQIVSVKENHAKSLASILNVELESIVK
jgi:hypothetical protein